MGATADRLCWAARSCASRAAEDDARRASLPSHREAPRHWRAGGEDHWYAARHGYHRAAALDRVARGTAPKGRRSHQCARAARHGPADRRVSSLICRIFDGTAVPYRMRAQACGCDWLDYGTPDWLLPFL